MQLGFCFCVWKNLRYPSSRQGAIDQPRWKSSQSPRVVFGMVQLFFKGLEFIRTEQRRPLFTEKL
jgi:hypothetical protein